jgi:hypothetical protein
MLDKLPTLLSKVRMREQGGYFLVVNVDNDKSTLELLSLTEPARIIEAVTLARFESSWRDRPTTFSWARSESLPPSRGVARLGAAPAIPCMKSGSSQTPFGKLVNRQLAK